MVRTDPTRPAPPTQLRRAIEGERQVWLGLLRGLTRRPDIPNGAEGFTHHRALAPVRWTGAALLVLEVGVVHLLVPAGPVRTVLLITGLYGLAWLAGYLLGAGPVRPHLVTGDRVVLRCGLTTDIVVPLDTVAQVRAHRSARTGLATVQLEGDVLSLVDNGGTSMELVLTRPLTVPGPRGRAVRVTAMRAWVDEPGAMVAAITSRGAPSGRATEPDATPRPAG